MRYLIKPCLLIQVGLSLLVNKNQVHKSDKVELRWEINSLQKYPCFFSLLAAGTGQRLLTAAMLVAGLWLAVAWAVH
jgi:hypothetical protein